MLFPLPAGVRVLDGRDALPAYSAELPADVDPKNFESGAIAVALTSKSFLLLSAQTLECYVGRVSVEGAPSVVGARLLSPERLAFRTRGLPHGTADLLVRLENPVLTIEAIARPAAEGSALLIPPPSSHELPELLLNDGAAAARHREAEEMHSPRALGFRPPLDEHAWEVELPAQATLIEEASFAEGLLVVEVAAPTSLDRAGRPMFTADGTEVVQRVPAGLWQGLSVEQGISRQPIAAGTPIQAVFSELVMVPRSRQPASGGGNGGDEAGGDGEDGLGSGSNEEDGRTGKGGAATLPEEYLIEARAGTLATTTGFFAPKTYLSADLEFVVRRDPADPTKPWVEVARGPVSPNELRRLVVDHMPKFAGHYELAVEHKAPKAKAGKGSGGESEDPPQGKPVEVFDGRQQQLCAGIRFEVVAGPLQIDKRKAAVSSPSRVVNGDAFKIAVTLSAADKYGNKIEVDPSQVHVVVTSRRTGQIVGRRRLRAGGGQQQEVEVLPIEPPLWQFARKAQQAKWVALCEREGMGAGQGGTALSLLDVSATITAIDGEVSVLGRLPSLVRVDPWPAALWLNEAQISAATFGLSVVHIKKLSDFGARAYRTVAKLKSDVRSGVVQCRLTEAEAEVEEGAEEEEGTAAGSRGGSKQGDQARKPSNGSSSKGAAGSQPGSRGGQVPTTGVFAPPAKARRVTRFFHVINVSVSSGVGGDSRCLVELSRDVLMPPSHDSRVLPPSRKFAPAQMARSPLVADAHLVAARRCLWRRLGLSLSSGRGGSSDGSGGSGNSGGSGGVDTPRRAVPKILLDDSSYETEYVIARSRFVPNLTEVYVVHTVRATVEGISPFSFAVWHDGYHVRLRPCHSQPHSAMHGLCALTAPPPPSATAPALFTRPSYCFRSPAVHVLVARSRALRRDAGRAQADAHAGGAASGARGVQRRSRSASQLWRRGRGGRRSVEG